MKYVFNLAALAAVTVGSPVLVESIHNDAAPIHSSSNAKAIPNSYMVVFKDHVNEAAAKDHHSWVQLTHQDSQSYRTELRKRSSFQEEAFEGLKHVYNIANLKGYSGHFDENTVEAIRRHPDVAFIEMDSEVQTLKEEPAIEKNSPWGLARLSHRQGLTFSTFNKVCYSGRFITLLTIIVSLFG